MVGRLRLADEDHIATRVGQMPGSRTSEHAAPDYGDVVAVAAYQLEMPGNWMVNPPRVALCCAPINQRIPSRLPTRLQERP
jgi:hypothetical protein